MNRERVQTAPQQQTAPPPAATAQLAAQLPMATPMPKQELKPAIDRSVAVAPKLYPPKIAKSMLTVSKKIQPVRKAGWNAFHKYAYPKWEDILDDLGPLIVDHGLLIIQSEIAHGGFERDLIEITYNFTIINDDGDVWPDKPEITAICKVRDSKGVIDDKAASKCRTQAEKNAMVQFFKIRTADMAEVDDEGSQQRPRRPVPAPDGKVPPHYIQGVEGETAQTWAAKFMGFVSKAASVDELDQWDEMNAKLLDLVKERDAATYNTILDAFEAREAMLTGKKPASANTESTAYRPTPGRDDLTLPSELDRREKKAPAPPADGISDKERDWLVSLDEAFGQINDIEALSEEQRSIMLPSKDSVGGVAWNKAVDILNKHIERIEAIRG